MATLTFVVPLPAQTFPSKLLRIITFWPESDTSAITTFFYMICKRAKVHGHLLDLFFESNTSRKESITAADVWRKDRTHNDYLKSKGYTVVRFWEKEIKCDIDRCIAIIKKRIQAFKKYT